MFDRYSEFYTEKNTEKKVIEKEINITGGLLVYLRKDKKLYIEARDIVIVVLKTTQDKAKSFIEEIVTLCIQTVYGKEYSAKLSYDVKRNQSEAELILVKNGNDMDLKDDVGGGVVDMYSFGMRIVLWALMKDRTEPFFYLDEPFKNLGDRIVEGAEVLQTVSKELGIQFVINTHDLRLMEKSDKAFQITQTKGNSEVKVI